MARSKRIHPFWRNLSEAEGDRYLYLLRIVNIWSGYCSLSKTKKELAVKPYDPSDGELFECEILAMKLWGMI